MRTVFLKWGNSLALRVPSAFAKELGAAEGKKAEMTVENGALVVKVAAPKKRRRYSLEQLIEQITENRHPEIDWDKAVAQITGINRPRKRIDPSKLRAMTDSMPLQRESARDLVRRMRDEDRY
jgi:antitoxin MazE